MTISKAKRSEKELVLAAVAGDLLAFDCLVRRHWAGVMSVARAFLPDSEEAEDVVQDTFVRAFERLSTLGPPYRFGPWVKQIALGEANCKESCEESLYATRADRGFAARRAS